jgi:two-component sensor histidine kinase
MNIFNPPKTNYSGYEDIGKFNMLWIVSLILVPIFVVLLFIHTVFGDPSWITSLFAMLVGIGNLIVLRHYRKYKLIGFLSIVFGIAICQSVIFIVQDSHLISDVMWCILVAFFTFFLFGSISGTIVLLFNLSGLVIYLLNASSNEVLAKGVEIENVDYKMVINVFYVALALAFVIHQMIQNNIRVNRLYQVETEKNEVLVQEIHHRVKNNLQIISSLLKLQASEDKNLDLQDQFGEAIGRINSMALIHEKLYQKNNLSHIDLRSYLIDLSNEISRSINPLIKVEIDIETSIRRLDIDTIVPVSLIFNELITNSIKHGFVGRKSGVISIKIVNLEGLIEMTYTDDGAWVSPIDSAGFGTELIETFATQLNGSFELDTNNGASYHFKFKH